MRGGGQWARFSSPLWACQRTLPRRVCPQGRLHTHLPLLIQSQGPHPASQSGKGGSDETARAAATDGALVHGLAPSEWLWQSHLGRSEVCCALPVPVSLQQRPEPPASSGFFSKAKEMWEQEPAVPGSTRPALGAEEASGPQRGLFLNGSAAGRGGVGAG